ncbi:MAG TPA: hypothetical protein VLQ48_04440 [Chloroflexia bacterium]|nr:hypothetical protein [Chloroflexia bacterium]
MEDLQARYRKLLLMVLPVMGMLVSGQALLESGPEVSVPGLILLLFFVAFFVYRLVVFVRTK